MKKFLKVMVMVMIIGSAFTAPAELLANHCGDAYKTCVGAAGDNDAKLRECVRHWAQCRQIPLSPYW